MMGTTSLVTRSAKMSRTIRQATHIKGHCTMNVRAIASMTASTASTEILQYFRRGSNNAVSTPSPTQRMPFSSLSSSTSKYDIQIVEVSPRDGLQNEPLASEGILTVDDKIELIRRLAKSGIRDIEMGSFVSPKWVPAMANSDEVMQGYYDREGDDTDNAVVLSHVLIPNAKGLQRALNLTTNANNKDSLVDVVAIGASASDTFGFKNWNCPTSQQLITEKCVPVAQALEEHNTTHGVDIQLRGYISCVVGCPYEGPIKPIQVAKTVETLLEMCPTITQISLGDTIGVGTPNTIRNMLDEVYEVLRGHSMLENTTNATTTGSFLAAHYHDTYGQALSNILASLEHPSGIRTIDSSVAGLGGCPYAAGASGNVATEDVIYML